MLGETFDPVNISTASPILVQRERTLLNNKNKKRKDTREGERMRIVRGRERERMLRGGLYRARERMASEREGIAMNCIW